MCSRAGAGREGVGVSAFCSKGIFIENKAMVRTFKQINIFNKKQKTVRVAITAHSSHYKFDSFRYASSCVFY